MDEDSAPIRMNAEVARKWQALAERRRRHLAEMYETGRWRRYYNEETLLAQMQETARLAEAWARLAVDKVTPLERALRTLERADPLMRGDPVPAATQENQPAAPKRPDARQVLTPLRPSPAPQATEGGSVVRLRVG